MISLNNLLAKLSLVALIMLIRGDSKLRKAR